MVAIERLFSCLLRPAGKLIIIIFVLSAFWGCHYRDGVSVTMTPGGKTCLNRVVVLPFQGIAVDDDAARMVSCPLCGAVFHVDKSSQQPSVAVVENIFLERLHAFSKLTVIPPDTASETYRRLNASPQVPLTEKLRRIGAELGADGVIVGHVYRFRERQGKTYSVKMPASVAFDVHLIRVSDGVTVWRASFDKTQSSLMEDVLQFASFYKWGGKWVTAKELTDEGWTEILKTFPCM